ncbi:MAG: hypothetical protein L3J69_05185 [Desulfobacula sp.]|nr:hypothetical protein [Desulfobacula sp.]
MAQQWYEPFNFTEWLKRAFSFLNIAVLIITAMFVFSEFRFDWFEKMAGSYLASTNELRPQIGPIWEKGKQTSNAHQYLNAIISKKEKTQKNVRKAASFSDLASSILPGEWVTLESREFKALYLSLQRAAALKVIEPAQLVWLLNNDTLDRIFCEGTQKGINIYFIDDQNRVIKKIELANADISSLETGVKPIDGHLSDMPEFQGRIYRANDFFKALFTLPKDIIPDLISHPEVLLRQDGKITHVGIWNESKNGYIRLGFELETNGVTQVIFVNGREWAVWQLSLNLKGNSN